MILDEYLSFDMKIIISIISGSIWIYFRTTQCYILLPRKSVLSAIMVSLWIYYNYYEPLFLPIGLIVMVIFYLINKDTKSEIKPFDKLKIEEEDLVSNDTNKNYLLV